MDDVDTSTVAPSMMSSTTAASTAGTSSPTSPRSTADLRADLKAALEAKEAAETRTSVLEAELARFKDQFTFANAAKEALEAQLREEITRREKAEEQVESLRGAVDAARRGVMQLQKQESDRAARRQSGLLEEEPSRKRQSLYLGNRRPVSQGPPEEEKKDVKHDKLGGLRELRLGSGVGHSRGMSTSLGAPPLLIDDNLPSSPRRAAISPRSPHHPRSPASNSPPPTTTTLTPPKSPGLALAPAPPPLAIPSTPAERRTSALSVASASSLQATSPILPVTNEHVEQLESARIETAALRAHVEALEMKLAEADEARAASDDCLRALREFLAADPEAGGGSVSLPPLPHEIGDDEPAPEPEPEKKGWGFGLWNETPKRRGSSSASIAPSIAPSTTSVTSPPPAPEGLPPVFENMADPMALDKIPPPPPPKEDKPKEETKGWLGGWRSTSTTAAPPPPEPAPEGANLGRSLTSFFGRRARAASLAAAKAEADKADAEAFKDKDEDAPLSSAVAIAAGESSEFGFKLPPSESEGSLKTLAARAERVSGDDDTQSRVAAAKAKAEALATERAEKRRARAAERLPGAMTADQILKAREVDEAKEAKVETTKVEAKEQSNEEKEEIGADKDKDEKEDSGLAYLEEPNPKPDSKDANPEPKSDSKDKPALSVSTAVPASTLSPPSSSKSPAASRSSLDSKFETKAPLRRRNSPTSSPVSPALSRGGSISPTISRGVSPNPITNEQEELADENEDEDKPANVPKRPQRRNASKRGRGSAKVARGRGSYV